VIDGKNLRVGKRVNGTMVQGFLYDRLFHNSLNILRWPISISPKSHCCVRRSYILPLLLLLDCPSFSFIILFLRMLISRGTQRSVHISWNVSFQKKSAGPTDKWQFRLQEDTEIFHLTFLNVLPHAGYGPKLIAWCN